MIPAPIVEEHAGILVVRDDLVPGGTKARYLEQLFEKHDHVVYASPAVGGAQLALAYCARAAGKQATIFVAKRAQPHPRTLEARAVGARVFQVAPGYLTNVQAKARLFAADHGAFLVPFGADMPEALEAIARAARMAWRIGVTEIWCASGSGVLTRGLQAGIAALGLPQPPRFYAVEVGRELAQADVGAAAIFRQPLKFDQEEKRPAPFPSCPNYDRKAWHACVAGAGAGLQRRALFWNVCGPSPTGHEAAFKK